jgi:putative CocE/NonD family hydrolase
MRPVVVTSRFSLMSRIAERALHLPPAIDRRVTIERDVAVTMDDDVDLLADVYTPAGDGPHPTILVRCPYGRRGALGLSLGRLFAERGYRVVLQSCRGTFGSGGEFRPYFHERADGLATIRWIERQPWFDGRLATNGPSYLGNVQWAVADAAGDALRALCTHVTFSNITDYWFRGDSFGLGEEIDWVTMVSEQETARLGVISTLLETRLRRIDRLINHLPIIELDELLLGRRVSFWRDLLGHPSPDDPHWAPVDQSSRVAEVAVPVLQVGGWYDLFLQEQLADRARLTRAPCTRLVVGPWTHAQPAGFGVQATETLRWLDRHVRGVEPSGESDGSSPVRVFVMGADEWRDLPAWPPPAQPVRWHLHAGGKLAAPAPEASEPSVFTYDPADPTPVEGGTLLRRSGGRRPQHATEARADVLVFTSETLAADVDVIGPVHADIAIESDLEHFDVFVRLCDVDRRGRSYNVCDGIQRVSPARFPRPASGVWSVPVVLWPTAQRFRAGHRIRVQVAGGAHPRFVRNLGTAEPFGTATEWRVAHQRVHHSPEHGSAIVLPMTSNPATVVSRP